MILFPLVRMLVQEKLSEYNDCDSLFAYSHTVSNSNTYDNTLAVPFHPDCLFVLNDSVMIEKFRQLTKPTMPQDDMNYWTLPDHSLASKLQYYMDYGMLNSSTAFWVGTTSDCSPSQTIPMPKFKKGDVIICKKERDTSGCGWCVEKGEIFYISEADHDTYWLRVIHSSCGTQKDFSIKSAKIDDTCSYYIESDKKSSTSYFPNLSNV